MKRILSVVAVAALVCGTARAQAPASVTADQLKDLKSKISYLIGTNIGRQMQRDGMDLDMNLFSAGMKDALAGAKPVLSDAEMQAAIAEFSAQQEKKEREMANTAAKQALDQDPAQKAKYEKNTAEAAAFMAANQKKAGVTTLPSGIQYEVLTKSANQEAASPKATDTVTTHYKGTLLDGTQFDSSYDRGQPASFPLNGVIPGWTEILQKMKPGDKWKVYIPGELAYGLRGTPDGQIGPNALLTFEIELIAIDQSPEGLPRGN